MSLRLYVDHNVHAAVVQGLRDRGVDLITAMEDGMATADDEDILSRAMELDRVVFTQDVDFLVITTAWARSGREFAGVIYGRQRTMSIGDAIRDVEVIVGVLDPADMRNVIERIPL